MQKTLEEYDKNSLLPMPIWLDFALCDASIQIVYSMKSDLSSVSS